MTVPLFLIFLILTACSGRSTDSFPLNITSPGSVTPVRNYKDSILIYELILSNPGSVPAGINGVEIIDSKSGNVISQLTTHTMNLRYLDSGNRPVFATHLDKNMTAIIYLWFSFPDDEKSPPESLTHRISGQYEGGKIFRMTTGPTLVSLTPAVSIGAPFREARRWYAANSISNTSKHRIAVAPVAGPVYLSQRYAIDWISLNDQGRAFSGDGKKVEDWDCYGLDLIAVADGTVSGMENSLPENSPGPHRAVTINKDTALGNYVALQIAPDQFVVYAHMIPGSVKVSPGDPVKKGDILGKLGNSGNSDAPHLHLHIADSAHPILAQGVPYHHDQWNILGNNPGIDALISGGDVFNQLILTELSGERLNQLPLENEILTFP